MSGGVKGGPAAEATDTGVGEGPEAEATDAGAGGTRTTNGVAAATTGGEAATVGTGEETTEADGAHEVLVGNTAAATGVGGQGRIMIVEAPVVLAKGAGDRRRGAAMGVPGAAVLRAGHPGHGVATEALTGVADTMGGGLGALAVRLRPGKRGVGGVHLGVPRNAGPRANTGKLRSRSAADLAARAALGAAAGAHPGVPRNAGPIAGAGKPTGRRAAGWRTAGLAEGAALGSARDPPSRVENRTNPR